MSLTTVAWVPGLPHLVLKTEANRSYQSLRLAGEKIGQNILNAGTERILFFSTQWISVLSTMFQAREQLFGTHVDENWHEWGNLPFQFRGDSAFATELAQAATGAGYATALVDYEGFPVDTGSIVANQLVNPRGLPVSMVSCHVYSDAPATEKLAATLARAIAEGGKKTAVIVVSSLSTNYFTTEIDLREDHIRDAKDEQWDQRLIQGWTTGKHAETEKLFPEYLAAVRSDMGLKAYYFVKGLRGNALKAATCHAYGPIYGTGNAVLEF